MISNQLLSLAILCMTLSFIVHANGEVFTAIADMKDLLTLEGILVKQLNDFIEHRVQTLNYVTERLDHYSGHNTDTFKYISRYVTNPVHSFLLVKRMFNDWGITISYTADSNSQNTFRIVIDHLRNHEKFPKKEDFSGAAIALSRLQQTYKLNAADLANGKIKNIQSKSNMSASDCYEIGVETLNQHRYHHSTVWLKEALNRVDIPSGDVQSLQLDILSNLAEAHRLQRDYKDALEATEMILQIDPDNKNATFLHEILREKMSDNIKESRSVRRQKRNDFIEAEIKSHDYPFDHVYPEANDDYHRLLYEAVCRGEAKASPRQMAPFRCRYVTNKSPFLKIAPLKLEEISLDPYIVLYHDVMYDVEIDAIKSLSKPKLSRAGVDAEDGSNKLETVDYRISKAAWFRDGKHKFIGDITNRVEDMSGFSMKTAENLQVVNYGIGGFYDTHFDYAPAGDTVYDDEGIGNRIATVLFYMSDVEEGGATAFHLIKRAVFPKKGAAVYWLNLHANGTGDARTKHAGCPVLVGSKWGDIKFSNKWLHMVGQEFIRPCGPHPYHVDVY